MFHVARMLKDAGGIPAHGNPAAMPCLTRVCDRLPTHVRLIYRPT
jgi:hypothetical protein